MSESNMDVSPAQRNTEKLARANIQDYLEDKVCLEEYHERKRLCDSLHTKLNQMQPQTTGMQSQAITTEHGLSRNSKTDDTDLAAAILLSAGLMDEAALSPASVDSAYSSSPPSPPLQYSQDAICRPPFQDYAFEDPRSVLHHATPVATRDQRACHGVDQETWEKITKCPNSCTATKDKKMAFPEPFNRQTSRLSVRYPHNKRVANSREAADIDEPDPGPPPKKKRNRGPKPRVLYEGKGPMQLWQLILHLLVSSEESGLVEWTRDERYGFKILQPEKLAKLWGELKKKPAMNFDKLSRSLRYYYDKSMLRKVAGKENTYEFTWDISEIIGYDPVRGSPVSNMRHASPVSSPESRSSAPDPVNELNMSDEVDSFSVSSPTKVLPFPISVNVPVPQTVDEFSVCNNPEELSVPVQGLWLPFLDVGDWLPNSNCLVGEPMASRPVGGPDVTNSEESLSITPPPLDFTMLVESDQKSNFYEVL